MTTTKPQLGSMILLHSAPANGGACMYCGKAQPWGAMEPCDGPEPLRAEIARLHEVLKQIVGITSTPPTHEMGMIRKLGRINHMAFDAVIRSVKPAGRDSTQKASAE
jgi:hypothetical protein